MTGTPSQNDHLIGYTDRWSLAAGETLRLMVSTTAPQYRADLVRIANGDPRPAGGGLRAHQVPDAQQLVLPGRVQPIHTGSYAIVRSAARLAVTTPVAVGVWIFCTRPGWEREQGLLSTRTAANGGWTLSLDAVGRPQWQVSADAHTATVTSPEPLQARRWYLLLAAFSESEGTMSLEVRPRDKSGGSVHVCAGGVSPRVAGRRNEILVLAASCGGSDETGATWAHGHYNGKLDVPVVVRGSIDDARSVCLAGLRDGYGDLPSSVLAMWSYDPAGGRHRLEDRGPHGMHADLINNPTRAVTGVRWTGHTTDWRHAADEYSAIHFAEDDLDDAKWDVDATVTIPENLTSGVYAVQLTAGKARDHVPFFLIPSADSDRNVALLLPTLTYLAYGNEYLPAQDNYLSNLKAESRPSASDHWLRHEGGVGGSLYDCHPDGTGHAYAGRLRPMPNLRPNYLHWLSGEPRHLGADLYIVQWLKRMGIAFDVITDEHLHDRGRELLDRYRVVITGNHPEYVTEAMLDSLDGFTADGGRLMYLGGNGFYWVTSIDPTRPHIIEVRRGLGGGWPWESPPGEVHHATTGEPGGLWRYRGRPPNRLVGVGFCAQGRDLPAPGYRVIPRGLEDEHAWLLEGVELNGDVLGDFGLLMGGAAGHEIDRWDPTNGSPPGAVVIASSSGYSRGYQPCYEELGFLRQTDTGEADANVRADVVFFTTSGGGAVFSVGSMCWVGSLPEDDFHNPVATLTTNALRAFLEKDFPP